MRRLQNSWEVDFSQSVVGAMCWWHELDGLLDVDCWVVSVVSLVVGDFCIELVGVDDSGFESSSYLVSDVSSGDVSYRSFGFVRCVAVGAVDEVVLLYN